jgi:hypothetical protein
MEKKTITTNIILTEDLWVRAKFRATVDRMSLSELMRRALTAYLDKSSMERGGPISKGKREDLVKWVKSHRDDKPRKRAKGKSQKQQGRKKCRLLTQKVTF